MLASWRGTRFEVSQVLREASLFYLPDFACRSLLVRSWIASSRTPKFQTRCCITVPRSVVSLWLVGRTAIVHFSRHRVCSSSERYSSRRSLTRATRSDESWNGASLRPQPYLLVDELTLYNRMVAEAASGKSKHHQLRAAQRAKKHEHAHAHTHVNGSGEKANGESTPAEKDTPASAA